MNTASLELPEIDISSLETELQDLKNVTDEANTEASTPTIYNISSYGADFSTEQHVKRMRSQAYIVPEFQRAYVWTQKKASRFIESLLLGLPVPSIFLYKDDDSGKHLVVDGQQRLRTVRFFFDGILGEKKFRLSDVHEKWLGRTYEELDEVDRQKIDDAIIHTIIFKQDEPSRDKSSVHHVFERLNTGGMNLTAQEIRVCVSHGNLANKLRVMNANSSWRTIYGKLSPRMKDQELVLRFLALHERWDHYERPMIDFLNSYMEDYKDSSSDVLERFAQNFDETIDVVVRSIGPKAFRPTNALNAAVYDACMVGIASRLKAGDPPDMSKVTSAYRSLLTDAAFRGFFERATADKDSVGGRIKKAIAAFSEC